MGGCTALLILIIPNAYLFLTPQYLLIATTWRRHVKNIGNHQINVVGMHWMLGTGRMANLGPIGNRCTEDLIKHKGIMCIIPICCYVTIHVSFSPAAWFLFYFFSFSFSIFKLFQTTVPLSYFAYRIINQDHFKLFVFAKWTHEGLVLFDLGISSVCFNIKFTALLQKLCWCGLPHKYSTLSNGQLYILACYWVKNLTKPHVVRSFYLQNFVNYPQSSNYFLHHASLATLNGFIR